MFKGLGGLGGMAALASNFGEIQKRIPVIHKKTGELLVTGSAGGGAVEVDVTGHGVMKACRVAPALLAADQADQLQTFMVEASNDAGAKAKAAAKELIKQEAEDLNVPGLPDMLAKIGM